MSSAKEDVVVSCTLTQTGPCRQCKAKKIKCSLMPLKADGQPDRFKFDTNRAKMLRHWVNATNEALQSTGKGKANNWETLSRDQPSHSPSSTLGRLGELSLQGDPSPTDVCPPLPDTVDALPPASRKSLAAEPTLPSPSQSLAPHNTADAPRRASPNSDVPHRNLAASSQPSVAHDMAGASRNTAVSRSSRHPEFFVEVTRRKAPKATSSSRQHSHRSRRISSTSSESAHAQVEPSQAGDEGTDSARIASLEQKVASLAQMVVSLQQKLETYEAWKAEVEEWRAEVDTWRADFE